MLPLGNCAGIGAEERVGVDRVPIPPRTVDGFLADLYQRAADGDAGDDLARDGTGRDARCRLPRRGAPAAAIVADAVLSPVGVVRVPGAELVLDLGVVLASGIDIADQKRDRRTRCHVAAGLILENAG